MKTKLTPDNYWFEASKQKKQYIDEHWRKKWFKIVINLTTSIIYRLALAYFVIPAIFFATSFILAGGTTDFSLPTKSTISIYHLAALLIFSFTWVIKPWRFPAKREVDIKMKEWHFRHGRTCLPEGKYMQIIELVE